MNANEESLLLEGSLTIKTIGDIKDRLTVAMAKAASLGAPLKVDIDSNAEIDITLPQLLLAAQNRAARLGTKLVLKNPVKGNFLSILERGGFVAKAGPENTVWLQGDL